MRKLFLVLIGLTMGNALGMTLILTAGTAQSSAIPNPRQPIEFVFIGRSPNPREAVDFLFALCIVLAVPFKAFPVLFGSSVLGRPKYPRLQGGMIAALGKHIMHVVRMGSKEKMLGIDATGIIAPMTDAKTRWDRAKTFFPDDAMHGNPRSLDGAHSISLAPRARVENSETSGWSNVISKWLGVHWHLLADAILGVLNGEAGPRNPVIGSYPIPAEG